MELIGLNGIATMTYDEYELLAKKHFERELKNDFHKKIIVGVRQNLVSPDGSKFNIDLNYRFKVAQIEHLVIVECKCWKSYVSKDVVLSLEAKKNSLKAHKAVVVTTNGFQSGAIKYAKKNGIALIKITSLGVAEYVNHFNGNYDFYSEELIKKSKLNNDSKLTSIGIITPRVSLGDYFKTKFGEEPYNALKDYFLSERIPAKNVFKKVPSNWFDEYQKIETCGLDVVLSNENEFRQINLLISLVNQKNFS